MWRIEEHQKVVSLACPKHTYKLGGEGKGMLHQESRMVGHGEEKNGWKTDFDTAGGEITMEFEASVRPNSSPMCDLPPAKNGSLEVKHNLVLELIVAEEFCSNRSNKLATPTGAARVLRMLFHLNLTERSGQGVSWDEEMPPVYGDVPASPPGYGGGDENESVMEDYSGSPLALPEYEDLERVERFERLERDDETQATGPLPRQSSARDPSPERSVYPSQARARLTHEDLVAEPQLAAPRARRATDSGPDDA